MRPGNCRLSVRLTQPTELLKIFAANVKGRRKELGLSQAEVATRPELASKGTTWSMSPWI